MCYKPGDIIYKYELKTRIGGGNFGEVWLSIDKTLNSICAVKLLSQNNISIDDRLFEAQIGNRLVHPNVVNIKYADVISFGSPIETVVAIAMPFYKNKSVTSQLNSQNFLDTKRAIKCLIDVLRGLEYLHENGYYHCDIKPNNILVGDHGEYVLTDYGITCYSPHHKAVEPRQVYFPHIAPETIEGNTYDERTDIYQLGLTAFRLLNGISEIKRDFFSDRSLFNEKVSKGKLISNTTYQPYVPKKIRRIINKATALNPQDRFQTALDMRRALEQISLFGNCSADSSGNIIITNSIYEHRYETVPKSDKVLDFFVYKKNTNSGRETKATRYCCKNVKVKDIKKYIMKLSNDLI